VSRRLAIPEPLRERQARASDPRTSAWVSANAGSGKTHVLTQRVLRLLLDRTPPAQILCVAYTKAAAANMAERVFSELARWTSLDDAALAKAIVDCGVPEPEPQDLAFARQLFARTIETPGGLKIQTLHGFAERLLKLAAIAVKAAAITLQLTQARDGRNSEPASLVFADDEMAALAALDAEYKGKTTLQTNPHRRRSLAWAAWIIARLGGWDGYPSSRPPGPITFKHGLDDFHSIAKGWKLKHV